MNHETNLEKIHRYAYYLLGVGTGFLIGGLINYGPGSQKRELLVPVTGVLFIVVATAIASLTKVRTEPKE